MRLERGKLPAKAAAKDAIACWVVVRRRGAAVIPHAALAALPLPRGTPCAAALALDRGILLPLVPASGRGRFGGVHDVNGAHDVRVRRALADELAIHVAGVRGGHGQTSGVWPCDMHGEERVRGVA